MIPSLSCVCGGVLESLAGAILGFTAFFSAVFAFFRRPPAPPTPPQ